MYFCKIKRNTFLKNVLRLKNFIKTMGQIKFELGNYYHIYNRGNNIEDIFVEERNYTLFLEMIKKYLLQVSDIYAYCLMANNFHLLVKMKEPQEIADEKLREKPYLSFAYMFNSYAKKYNKTYDHNGSLFREHLKRQKIEGEDFLKQVICYIHLNPIKYGITDTFEYVYSSYNAMISRKKTLLKRKEVLEFFGGIESFIDYHNLQKQKYENLIP